MQSAYSSTFLYTFFPPTRCKNDGEIWQMSADAHTEVSYDSAGQLK